MRHRPLLVGAAAFAAGIGMGAEGWLPLALVFGLACIGLIMLAAGRIPALLLAGLSLLGISAGGLRLAAFGTIPVSDVSHFADRIAPTTVLGTVISDPEARRGGRITLFLRVEAVQTWHQSQAATGDVAVTLGPDAAQGVSPDYGDRMTLEGTLDTPPSATNPGAFSWRDYLARREVYCDLRVKRRGGVEKRGASQLNPYVRMAWAVRHRVLTAIHTSLPPTQAAVLAGILIGRRSELPPDLTADFVHTGTVHILASAGLHVGIVAFWLKWLCRRLTLPRKSGALLTIATLWIYALMAGGRPSVTRAVVMATLYFGAVLFEREPDAPTTVGAAALLILAIQPTALLEPGFQMSFLTILTLAVTMPVWDSVWRPHIEARFSLPVTRKAALWATDMTGLSLLAQIGALPIVALNYNEVSLTGWLANLLVVPALFALIPIGFLGAALWSVWHGLGALLLTLTGWGIERILAIVRGLGEAPWAYRALPAPPLPLILGFYCLVYGGTDAIRKRFTAPPSAAPPAANAARPAAVVGAVPPP